MREEYGWLPEAKAVEAAQAAAAQFGGLPGATFIHPTDEGHRAHLVETTPDTPLCSGLDPTLPA
eukprot:gene34808-57545_t